MRIAGVVDSGLLEHMMGHHNLRLMHNAAYDEFDPDYIRKEYSNAESYLGSDDRPGFSWSRKCLALWRARTPTRSRPRQQSPNEVSPTIFKADVSPIERISGKLTLGSPAGARHKSSD